MDKREKKSNKEKRGKSEGSSAKSRIKEGEEEAEVQEASDQQDLEETTEEENLKEKPKENNLQDESEEAGVDEIGEKEVEKESEDIEIKEDSKKSDREEEIKGKSVDKTEEREELPKEIAVNEDLDATTNFVESISKGKQENNPVISDFKTDLEQELVMYSEIQKALIKEKLTIEALTKKLRESKKQHKETEIQYDKEIVGRDLEIKVFRRSLKNLSDEVERVKRKSRLIREKFEIGIISEIRTFLTKKLDAIEKVQPQKTTIVEKTQHYLDTIQELGTTVKLKNTQIRTQNEEIKRLRTEISRFKPSQEKLKNLVIRVNQENKKFKSYVEKLIKDNEFLRKELDQINDELSK